MFTCKMVKVNNFTKVLEAEKPELSFSVGKKEQQYSHTGHV